MVGVPRYISQQDFQPIQSVSAAPALDALSDTFDKLGQSLGIQAATQEGIKAGEKPGFQPIPALTPTAEAFNQSALQTNKLIANNQAAQHLAQLKENADNQFQDPQKAAQFFNSNATAYLKNFIKQVPTQNKPYLEASLNHQLLVTNADYNMRIQKQKSANAFVSYVGNQQSNFDGMNGALQEGDLGLPTENTKGAAQQYYQQIITSGKLALENGMITKPQFVSLTNKAQKSYQTGAFMHGAQNALKAGPEVFSKYISDANEQGIPGLSTNETTSLINRAKTLALNNINGAAIDAQVINQNAKQNLKDALQTGTFNQSEANQFSLLHPLRADQHNQQLQTNQLIHSDAVRISSQNSDLQNKMLASLKNNYSSTDFASLQSVVKSKNIEIEKNPFLFYSKNPAVLDSIFQNKNVNLALQQMGVKLSPTELQNATPSEKIILAQKIRGMSGNQLWATTRGDAESSAVLLQNGTLQQVQSKFSAEQKRLGSDFPIYINNISKVSREDGTPIDGSLLFAASLNPNDPQSTKVFQALRTPLSVLENSNNVTKENREALNTAIGGLFQNVPNVNSASSLGPMSDYIQIVKNSSSSQGIAQHLSSVQKYLKHVSLYYVSQGQDPKTALQSAENVFTSRLNFVNQYRPTNFNSELSAEAIAKKIQQAIPGLESAVATGPQIAIPKMVDGKPVDPNTILNYLSKASNTVKNFNYAIPPNVVPNSPPTTRRLYYFNHFLKSGHWVTNSSFTGYLYVDNLGRVMVDKTGKPFEISNSDAINNIPPANLVPQPAFVKKLFTTGLDSAK